MWYTPHAPSLQQIIDGEHEAVLQAAFSQSVPVEHCSPVYIELYVIVLDLHCSPPPHEALQLPHADHEPYVGVVDEQQSLSLQYVLSSSVLVEHTSPVIVDLYVTVLDLFFVPGPHVALQLPHPDHEPYDGVV